MILRNKIQAATTRLDALLCLNWPCVALFWYLIGLLLFHTLAFFDTPEWDNIYFCWDKAKDCLFILALFRLLPTIRTILKPILFYSIIRLCFQIAGIYLKMGSNHLIIVTALYTIALTATIYLTLTKLKEEWSQN